MPENIFTMYKVLNSFVLISKMEKMTMRMNVKVNSCKDS